MNPATFLTFSLLAAAITVSSGRRPSSVAFHRTQPDSAYVIDVKKNGTAGTLPGASFFVSSADDFPALGASDINAQLVRVTIKAGDLAAANRHPNGGEIIYVLKGKIRLSFEFPKPKRVVTNIARRGQFGLFPRSLFHSLECLGKVDCVFVGVFNNADPGLEFP